MVAVNVTNRAEQPAEVLATMYFAGDPNLQYARQLWLPARSRRYSWCPIRPPVAIPAENTLVEIKSMLFDRSGQGEVLVRPPVGPMQQSDLLPLDRSRVITGVIYLAGGGLDEAAQATLEAAGAAKLIAGRSSRLSDLHGTFLPPVVESLHGLDQLVLASDRLASDAAGLTAVRRWLLGGGRLWIMLDRVEPATVEMLLGDAFRCHVVDRTGLTDVWIKEVSPDGKEYKDQPREFEEPVDLVRVLASDVEIHHTVGGWPASFWKRVGKGEVLFTALGARGWIRPYRPGDPTPKWPVPVPRSSATEPLEILGNRFFRPREPPALDPRQFEPFLSEQIGYRIVGRGWVAGVLGAFCLFLLAAGVRLRRRKRLERIAWIGPAAAAAATLALIVMGMLAKQAVPPTVAVAQWVEVGPGTDDLHVAGLMATYTRQKTRQPVGARRGGVFDLDMTGLGGTARRIVRTDLDTWHWQNLTLPAGVRAAPFEFAARIERPITARATFGPGGVRGSLTCEAFEDLTDAIIVTPTGGRLAAEINANGDFAAGAEDVLAPGQFIAGGMLSDEQRRRDAVYRQLLGGVRRRAYPPQTTLLAWARPLEMQFRLPEQARRLGSALVAVPLEIERPSPGTPVVIPPPFLDYRPARGPSRQISAVYNYRKREWLEFRQPSQACLRFQIPGPLLPMEVHRARLTVRINAPSRKVELFGVAGGKPVTLARRNSPVGTWRVDVDRTEVLQLDDGGGLLLGMEVGEDQSPLLGSDLLIGAGSAWKVESVRLELAGQTLDAAK